MRKLCQTNPELSRAAPEIEDNPSHLDDLKLPPGCDSGDFIKTRRFYLAVISHAASVFATKKNASEIKQPTSDANLRDHIQATTRMFWKQMDIPTNRDFQK